MRTDILETDAPAAEGWLKLHAIARVSVTSQDPDCPITSAFKRRPSRGWRSGEPGEQTIRLIFNPPQHVRRIYLRFVETESERTQEFSLRWRTDRRGPSREIVRQQWNFSPHGSTIEIEDYKVDLNGVATLELTINPDIGGGDAIASLAEWHLS